MATIEERKLLYKHGLANIINNVCVGCEYYNEHKHCARLGLCAAEKILNADYLIDDIKREIINNYKNGIEVE